MWGCCGVAHPQYWPCTEYAQKRLHGQRCVSASLPCLLFSSCVGTTISELHIQGCVNGLRIHTAGGSADNVATFHDIAIRDCFFADIRGTFAQYNPSLPNWGTAIIVDGQGTMKNFSVEHTSGIRMDSFFRGGIFLDGLNLEGNTVAQCGGNCYFIGSCNNLKLRNSVFIRDTPDNLFLYGTTDIIFGSISGTNEVVANDFNLRGEYEGGPDGCAIDFETSASGVTIANNTIYRSWGGGIMIFGHDTTSHDLAITGNTFAFDGCVQTRGDHAGVAVMCPGGHAPSGKIEDNAFLTCPGVETIYINPAVPDCASNLTMTGNTNNTMAMVKQPQLNILPVAPNDPNDFVTMPIVAVTQTAGAVLRYTTDGSRPTETSPVVPPAGVEFGWPGPNFVFNVRGFKDGMLASITNTVVVERALYQSRMAPQQQPLRSAFDFLALESGKLRLLGWVVDPNVAGGGLAPVNISLEIDLALDGERYVANVPRPDLVKAGVAPNPDHGFDLTLTGAVATRVSRGKHLVTVLAAMEEPGQGVPTGWTSIGSKCTCDGAACDC